MIKIATISTSDKGGAGIAAFRLHENLNHTNVIKSSFLQADMFGYNRNNHINVRPNYPNKFKRGLKKLGFDDNPDLIFKKQIAKNPANYEIATSAITNFRLEAQPKVLEADIIHLHWVANFINYPTFFKQLKNKPIVWTLHDMNPFQGLFHYKEDALKNKDTLGAFDRKMFELKKKALKKHRNIHIVCYAKWMFETSKNSELLGEFQHHFIPQGIDFSELQKFDILQEKIKLNLNNNKKTLLFLAQSLDNHRKGGDLLRTALSLVKDKNFNLITIGSNVDRINIPSEINHLHFDHTANVQDLYKFYAISDLTILPSREDNLPNIMLESFANGTPILSFNVGGMKDHVFENTTGLIAEDLSSECLAKKIDEFLLNKYNFDAYKIREYAMKNFSSQNQVKNYTELYKSLI